MLVKAHGECPCGVSVKGELDEASREFVHRFSFPRGAEPILQVRATEVEGIRLVTFPPGDEWSVDCPVCRGKILLLKPP